MSTREDYERDLRRRQEEHLAAVKAHQDSLYWQPCRHDQCPECVGTGLKLDGSICVHHISCPCPKCSPQSRALRSDSLPVSGSFMEVRG